MKSWMFLCSLISSVPAAAVTAKVVGVPSGSLLDVLKDGQVFRLRIQGIVCAGGDEPAGKAARQYVAEKACMGDVQIEIAGLEPDGSPSGRIWLADGSNLGELLVKVGLAWWDRALAPHEEGLARLEEDARESYRGIWAGAAAC